MNSAKSAARPALMMSSFDTLSAFLKRASGLTITADKLYLVENRLLPIVEREKLSCLNELVNRLERGAAPSLVKDVIQAMTVNETYFFRDKLPFDQLRDIMLPKLMAARTVTKSLRIWCAASSTGQEPYSIAMLLEDNAAAFYGWRFEIVASDLSEAALSKARSGIYTQFEVQRGLSTAQLLRHFVQLGDTWQISEKVRSRVSFRQVNLVESFSHLGMFDIIFCRNVMIYFDAVRKADVLGRLANMLQQDGFLVLGAAESAHAAVCGLAPHPASCSLLTKQPRGAVRSAV